MTEQQSLFSEPIVSDPAASLPLAVCRGCGRAMIWIISTKGGAVPLDPAPVRDGNLVFELSADTPTIRYLRKDDVVPDGTAKYKSHFATCPEAHRFRRTV